MTLPRFPKFCNACKLILCAKVTIFISLQDNACNHIFHLFTDNEETPEYGTGVRQSSNAKITFNDEEYFQKVGNFTAACYCKYSNCCVGKSLALYHMFCLQVNEVMTYL